MAKLSAFGRTTLLTFTKDEFFPPGPATNTVEDHHKLRLMSDGVVLQKRDLVASDGQGMSWGWTKKGKVKNWPKNIADFVGREELIQHFKDYATKRGYTEMQ